MYFFGGSFNKAVGILDYIELNSR